MEKRTLGNTGLEVSVVGFGAMTIGGRFGPVDDAESNRALHAAIDGGMNFIDTSNAYGEGRSENLIGKFLKERPDRDDLILCTKGGNNFVALERGGWGRDFTPGFIGKCLEESLGRLGVEAISLYLLHNPKMEDMKAEDCYALLDKARDDGKLKCWGVSVNTVEECDYAIESGKATLLQMEYNVLQQEAAGSFQRAKEAGVGVICRVPLKRGFLSGKIDETVEFTEDDMRRRILTPERIRKFQGRLNRLRDVAGQLNITPAEAALRFCVSNRNISIVIPGIRTAEQASQNARCGEALPIEAIKRLEEGRGKRCGPCRMPGLTRRPPAIVFGPTLWQHGFIPKKEGVNQWRTVSKTQRCKATQWRFLSSSRKGPARIRGWFFVSIFPAIRESKRISSR
ncbi:MAG TPA: hypothetical protein DDZ83_19760 [Nitrospinae bacterium]|nr:hypothetical protein [Nitrospinota bacterium]